MKKLVLLVAIMASSMAAYAQAKVGSWTVTPSVGMTVANITNSNADYKIGLIAGADAMYQVNETIGISGGLFFAQQGCKDKENGYTAKLKNNYLNVPLMVNAYVAPGLALKLGVQPSFLLSAKASASASGVSGTVDLKDAYNTIDLSLPVGLSYEFNRIVLDARYNLGLTKVLSDTPSDDNGKNSVIQFTVGYRF